LVNQCAAALSMTSSEQLAGRASAPSDAASGQMAADEVAQYLWQTHVPLRHCPLVWWREHAVQYPCNGKVAQR